MNKVEKVLEFFKENPDEIRRCGVFNSRNIVGDRMYSVAEIEGIQIDACYEYDYLELFGFTENEFKEFKEKYNKMLDNEEQ